MKRLAQPGKGLTGTKMLAGDAQDTPAGEREEIDLLAVADVTGAAGVPAAGPDSAVDFEDEESGSPAEVHAEAAAVDETDLALGLREAGTADKREQAVFEAAHRVSGGVTSVGSSRGIWPVQHQSS